MSCQSAPDPHSNLGEHIKVCSALYNITGDNTATIQFNTRGKGGP
ncbi:unnamed protein product, partial [Staurois parvus]